MKNFIYYLVFILLLSCKNDKDKVQPSPDLFAGQQAPFGNIGVDVKLNKVLYNGELIKEFFYDNSYLTEWKGYVTFDKVILSSTGIFKRNGKILSLYEVTIADEIIEEYQYVSEKMKKRNTLTFDLPTSYSTRDVVEEYFTYPRTYSKKFLFDKDGYIIEEDASNATEGGYVINYVRNSQKNISDSWRKSSDNSGNNMAVKYKYDNNPNPFFKLGVDWYGEVSYYALSPNNIVEEAYLDEDNRIHITSYTYEYLSNGYPQKVTVVKSVNGIQTEPYQMEFFY